MPVPGAGFVEFCEGEEGICEGGLSRRCRCSCRGALQFFHDCCRHFGGGFGDGCRNAVGCGSVGCSSGLNQLGDADGRGVPEVLEAAWAGLELLFSGTGGNQPAAARQRVGDTVNLPFLTTYLLRADARRTSSLPLAAGRMKKEAMTSHFLSQPRTRERTSYSS